MNTDKGITYTHFGKPADVWKHLVLCEVLKNEQPSLYVETNSACADYRLTRTPEQEYGIYHFIEKGAKYKTLFESVYFKQEYPAVKENHYMGSPGLAMQILQESDCRFLFYDIESGALDNVQEFARQHGLEKRVRTILQDSITGVIQLLPQLPKNTLLHVDPYLINQPADNGYDYLDVFVKASLKGMKCILWYGFHTLDEKKELNTFIRNKLADKGIQTCAWIELIMNITQQNSILCNPGILGNGILTSNLSSESVANMLHYSKLLEDHYRKTVYKGFDGGIYRDFLQ